MCSGNGGSGRGLQPHARSVIFPPLPRRVSALTIWLETLASALFFFWRRAAASFSFCSAAWCRSLPLRGEGSHSFIGSRISLECFGFGLDLNTRLVLLWLLWLLVCSRSSSLLLVGSWGCSFLLSALILRDADWLCAFLGIDAA